MSLRAEKGRTSNGRRPLREWGEPELVKSTGVSATRRWWSGLEGVVPFAALDVGEDPVDGCGLGDDGDDGHLDSAARTDHRVDFEDLPKEASPTLAPGLREGVFCVLRMVGCGATCWRFVPGRAIALPDAVGVGTAVENGVKARVWDVARDCVNPIQRIEDLHLVCGSWVGWGRDEDLAFRSHCYLADRDRRPGEVAGHPLEVIRIVRRDGGADVR